MFDLDQAIAEWRKQMLAAGIKTPVPLDELENHLREDIERQMRSGVNAPQAFEDAVQQIGQAGVLKKEFKKIGGTSSLLQRLMISIALVFVGFIILLSSFTIFVCFERWGERVTAFAAVACILLVACGWRYGVPFLPVIRSKRTRIAVGSVCILSGFITSSIFCQLILPHFVVGPDGQLPAIGLWAVFLIAISVCAGLGLMMSAHERETWGMKESPHKLFTSPDS